MPTETNKSEFELLMDHLDRIRLASLPKEGTNHTPTLFFAYQLKANKAKDEESKEEIYKKYSTGEKK